ncbi:DUF995 domain-containing protein [Rhizobium puerariae]|uniref:DUF995 domain-containing protein n=1 Tax=Rhizobium puerariae TaxID=1585791 RepID=A0ABV6AJ82_9HYPH
MSKIQGMLLAVALAGGLATAASAAGPTAPVNVDAAKPLTNAEIQKLYSQNSWIWKSGAGYFSPREQRFTAWSRENGAASYGIGRWFITEPGKLCFNADWHAKTGSSNAITCFSHRRDGNVIYQKREPDGEWYVFRNQPMAATDEFAKLRHGDYVGPRLTKIQATVGKAK